jgi:PAS domain S-box-containing protein
MLQKTSILLVEDNFDQALMVQDFLRLEGQYHVDWARDIQQTWSLVNNNPYDVILMDYHLPDGNGIDFLKEFCQKKYNTPVIMVTGEGDEQIAVQSIQLGALDYVVKRGSFYISLPAVIEKVIREFKLQESVKRSIEQIKYQALLLNNVRDSVIVWDLSGKITFINQAAQAMMGIDVENDQNIAEEYINRFIPPIALNELHQLSNKEIERQVIGEYDNPYVSSKIMPLFENDVLIGYMDVLRDISEIKKKEQELNKLTSAIENSAESVVITDAHGKIEYVNPAFEKMSHKLKNSVIDHYIYHFRGKSQENFNTIYAELIQGRTYQTEDWYMTDDGASNYSIEEIITPVFNQDHQMSNIIFTGRDITLRKRMEKEIDQAREKISESTRLAAIGELSSGVAHRIYNPLTSIIANTQMLSKTSVSNEEMIEILGDIEKAGWTAQNVVQQLLMFSKPDIGSLTEFEITETIENAILLVGGQLNDARIQINTILEDQTNRILGNQRQLEDLWVNLLLMAKDAIISNREEIITIHTYIKDNDWIIIEISDPGIPVPNAKLIDIFEPDFVGTERIRGSGLELSICREIVRQHNGSISAESSDVLTTFRVVFPVNNRIN